MRVNGVWKQKRAAAALWSVLLSGIFSGTVTAEAKMMSLAHFTLDNGMEAAVIENHKAPIVLQMLYYKTGSVNDPKGKGGIAHLLEHMMFRGTKRLPERTFDRLTEEHGAQNNAYTTYDETAYYEFSDISKLELMMALEAERMQNLTIDEDAFLKERDVVLQERRQRFETSPAPLFYETLNKLLWQEHPLANPVSGTPREIMALSSDDARRFYRRYYRPDNALLVLSGDIDADEAKKLVQKYYGGLKNPAEETKAAGGGTPPEFGRAAAVETVMRLDGVQQPRYADYIRLDAGDYTKKDILALDMLAEYLTGDDTAFLSDRLVYREKKLLGVDMGVSYNDKLGGTLSFYAVPAGAEDLRQIKEMIHTGVADGLAALTIEKLDKLKNRVLSDAVYLQENPQTAAQFAGAMLTAGYTPEEIMNYDEAVRAVSLDDIRAAWDKAAAGRARVTGYLEGGK